MKILVCPHNLDMGGSQLSAIKMAAAVRRHGHEPIVYAPHGVLEERIAAAGLEHVLAPDTTDHRAWRRRLAALVAERDIGLVHAYEWGPCLDAAFVTALHRVPVLMSVMSMGVPAFLPRHLPITVGTPELASAQAGLGRTAFLLEPPVDTEAHRVRDVAAARRGLGIGPDELVVSVVSMLTTELEKLQGVLATMVLVDRLAADYPVRMLVAGDGEGLEQVRARAARINAGHGRTVVQPLGFLMEPGPAYEAADVVLGMGSSALRGMAYAKPLIVQGEAGFWRLAEPGTVDGFRRHGWFGRGGNGISDLERELRRLFDDPQLRTVLGGYGRSIVDPRYTKERASAELSRIYGDVALRHQRLSATASSLARSAIGVGRFRAAVLRGNVIERQKWVQEGVAW